MAHPAGAGVHQTWAGGWLREPLIRSRPGPGDPQIPFLQGGLVGCPGSGEQGRGEPLNPLSRLPRGRHGLGILRGWLGREGAHSEAHVPLLAPGAPSSPWSCTPNPGPEVQSSPLFCEPLGPQLRRHRPRSGSSPAAYGCWLPPTHPGECSPQGSLGMRGGGMPCSACWVPTLPAGTRAADSGRQLSQEQAEWVGSLVWRGPEPGLRLCPHPVGLPGSQSSEGSAGRVSRAGGGQAGGEPGGPTGAVLAVCRQRRACRRHSWCCFLAQVDESKFI